MNIPSKKKILFLLSVVLSCLLFIIGFMLYTPPLLRSRNLNPLSQIYDFFIYSWYYSQAVWCERVQNIHDHRKLALAVWYRPSQAEAFLEIPPTDYYSLARKYLSLGLINEASLLFKKAFISVSGDQQKSLDIISYLAILGDWATTAETAGELLEQHQKSSEANYWYGRALLELGEFNKSRPYLKTAYQLNQALIDSIYQLGRVNEELGQMDRALEQYKEVVAYLPGHRQAWKALELIYDKKGEKEKQKEAGLKYLELTPQVSYNQIVGNNLLFLGYNLNRGDTILEEEFSLDYYVQGWQPNSVNFQAQVCLVSDIYSVKKSCQQGKAFIIQTTNEVIKRSLVWEKPHLKVPGKYNLKIAFNLSGPKSSLKTLQNESSLLLTTITASPRLYPATRQDKLIKQYFGEQAQAVGNSLFLSPGYELDLTFDKKDKISALALISYGRFSPSIPQGQLIAQITVKTKKNGEIIFPVRAGIETALAWWDHVPTGLVQHQKPPIFRSLGSERIAQGSPKSYEYYTSFRFNCPINLESIQIKYTANEGILYIADMVLIPAVE